MTTDPFAHSGTLDTSGTAAGDATSMAGVSHLFGDQQDDQGAAR